MLSSQYTAIPNDSQLQESSTLQSDDQPTLQETNDYPDEPPLYQPSQFEAFEMDDTDAHDESDETSQYSGSLLNKMGEFAQRFNKSVVQPINNALDPVYQLYCYINAKLELYVAKMGNPLIVKRILYILVITVILYLVSMSGINTQGVVGAYSDFTDPQKLSEFIEYSVDASRLEESLEYFSSMPHMAGTAGDLALSRYFTKFISKSSLELDKNVMFDTYINYPLNPSVQLYDSDNMIYECTMKEAVDTKDKRDDIDDYFRLAFNPGSKDATAKGRLMFANYGEQKDYKLLESKSLSVKGCIVLVKYGGVLPAYKKLRYAQENGALGILFISDPKLSSVYTMDSIQREPVAFADRVSGNIINPGNGAGDSLSDEFDARKLLENSESFPSIPSLPISWRDFIGLMDQLKNQGTHLQDFDFTIEDNHIEVWSGGDYEIKLQNTLTQRPNKEAWNIVGRIKGSEQETLAIVIGAPRDSVCYGATENTGSAVLLELMNIFSEMSLALKWRPLRSIYFISFSGTKYNMAGASNFAMAESDFFKRNAYAYIDIADIISGNKLEVSNDPLFNSIINNAIGEITDPIMNSSLYDIKENDFQYKIDPISNSLPFVSHFGLMSLSLKFSDSTKLLNYPKNSCLDNFERFQSKQVDPEMKYHVTATKLLAHILIKIAETPIIPLDIRAFVTTLDLNARDLRKYVDFLGGRLDFSSFETSLVKMKGIAEQHESFYRTWAQICDDGKGSEPNLLSVNRWDWNSKLLILNKVMLSTDGTWNRPWNYNVFFGREMSYPETGEFNGDSYPGVRDAIDAKDWVAAQDQLDLISDKMDHCLNLFQYS